MNTIKKTTLLAAMIVTSFMMTAQAQDNCRGTAPVAELKAAGKQNNQPLFQLDVKGVPNDQFYILITDPQGEVLYEETARGEKMSRLFRLNTEEVSAGRLLVQVLSRRTNGKTSFEIVNTVKQVYETVVVPGSAK